MDQIHQRPKLGQMVLAIKRAKTVVQKKTEQIDLFVTELRFSWVYDIKEVFLPVCSNHADFSFISLNATCR